MEKEEITKEFEKEIEDIAMAGTFAEARCKAEFLAVKVFTAEREKALKALPRECGKDEIDGANGKTKKSVEKWSNFADGFNECRQEFLENYKI